jgi:hypothetical protein
LIDSLEHQIDEVILLIRDFRYDPLVQQFLKSWETNLLAIKNKIKNKELSKKELLEIRALSSEIINSLILKWTIPHDKLEKLLNILTLKNNILKNIDYNQEQLDNLSIIDEIDEIIKTLRRFNDDKMVNEFIEYWNDSRQLIKNKIDNNQLKVDDIKQIQNILNEITDSLSFYFIIPHKELEKLLNILTLKNKYIFVFKK